MAKQLVDVSTQELVLDAEWHVMDNLEAVLTRMHEQVRKRRNEWNKLQAHMLELKTLGLIYAGTTWKNGKYLYLVYPSKDGGPRKRVYIGQEEAKINEALAGIQRGEDYLKLQEKANWLNSQCSGATFFLSSALDRMN